MESVEKMFSPARFEGRDVLRKRQFTRKPGAKGKVEFSYKGRSAVVVSSNTPFIFYFNLKSQKVNNNNNNNLIISIAPATLKYDRRRVTII